MKTKFSLFLWLATLLLFGCASPAEMRARAPLLELSSIRPSKPVAVCIADRWENTTYMNGPGLPITMRETTEGYTVIGIMQSMVQTWTGLLADINNSPSGSTTRYYKSAGMLSSGSFDNVVKECQ